MNLHIRQQQALLLSQIKETPERFRQFIRERDDLIYGGITPVPKDRKSEIT